MGKNYRIWPFWLKIEFCLIDLNQSDNVQSEIKDTSKAYFWCGVIRYSRLQLWEGSFIYFKFLSVVLMDIFSSDKEINGFLK